MKILTTLFLSFIYFCLFTSSQTVKWSIDANKELTTEGISVNVSQSAHQSINETILERDKRMKWFHDARFGMFIHWGVYSVPAGEWKGKPTPFFGEWMNVNGESIYSFHASPFPYSQEWSMIKTRPGKIFVHVFDWPSVSQTPPSGEGLGRRGPAGIVLVKVNLVPVEY